MPKKRSYVHLSQEERDRIAVLRSEGWSLRQIATRLKRNVGTLSRELKRNAPPVYTGYYLSHMAHVRATTRNRESHRRPRLKTPRIRRYIRDRIEAGSSPELAAGRWSMLHPELPISHEAVYEWIYTEATDLVPLLLRHHKRRRRKGEGKTHKTSHIPGRIPIQERPKEILTRQEAGHWEADTAVSRQSHAAIQMAVERKTRIVRLSKLRKKGAHEMDAALRRRLGHCPKRLRLTVTYDNGSENTQHEATNRALGMKSYFCTPYHSWEKGTVENRIGYVRRFLPKKTDFATVSNKKLRAIEYKMNHRSMKCLGYFTPAEAYRAERVALAC